MPSRDLLLGALYLTVAEFMFASMGASVKMASAYLPNEVLVFWRNLIGIFLIAPWLLRGGRCKLRTGQFRYHLLRGLAGLGAMYCFYYAIAHMALAEAMLLKMTAPLFIPLIAFLWLRESVPASVRWALLIGFSGVILILQPGFSGVSLIALVALAGGALAAVAKVTVRRLTATEPGPRIVFYFALIGALVSALPLAWNWVTPPIEAWGLVFAIAVFSTAGQLLMTRGYSHAPASQIAAFTYTAVLFATAYGWLFWDEVLDLLTFTGAALVITAGILTSHARARRPGKGESNPAHQDLVP
jgi:drug/metabolite transporter (DMT)-like permease